MERRGVIVEAGVVVNTILWSDETNQQLADDGLEHYEETTSFAVQPGIGWTWSQADGYRPPSPYPSWKWSKALGTWDAPVAKPEGDFEWNEETKTWDALPTPTE